MKGLVVLLLIIVILAFTNPSPTEHKEKIAAKNNIPFAWILLPITYKDYYVASTSSFKGEIISVGFLSMVFFVEDFEELLKP